MSSEPNDRLAEIRAAAERIIKRSREGLPAVDETDPLEIESNLIEAEAALEEAQALAVRIRDLAT